MNRRNLENLSISHPISEHPNGQNALDYLRQKESPEAQFLILLDINMPVMNGWEFLQECNNNLQLNNIFTVMLSSSTTKQDKEKALSFPQVIEFFEKPFLKSSAVGLAALKEIGHFFTGPEGDSAELVFEA